MTKALTTEVVENGLLSFVPCQLTQGKKIIINVLMTVPDPKQLPHLLKLLDDDSPVVQETIVKELLAFGPSLQRELARLKITLSKDQQQLITRLLDEHNQKWLRDLWPTLRDIEDDKEMLESALGWIAEFQHGRAYPGKLTELLDKLSEEFESANRKQDALTLAHFLFTKKQLRGTEADYYNPLNSNLVYVIEQKRGIPISLAAIYILVAARLGFDVEGINLPGHFLARASVGKQNYIVDCFKGGRCLDVNDLITLNNGALLPLSDLLQLECDATAIVARTLRNLVHAYEQEQSTSNASFMKELLVIVEEEGPDPEGNEEEE
ncbi:MAG TPA: transglutaminase-like domain-containing protein [Bacteroidota bacterium]|nr:transglutaminase-like domain-containing protein [Bacteroidota bacterium]